MKNKIIIKIAVITTLGFIIVLSMFLPNKDCIAVMKKPFRCGHIANTSCFESVNDFDCVSFEDSNYCDED